jgi:Ca2+-transporting ATPase
MRKGLTSAEASERLNKNGYNELPTSAPKRIGRIALEVIREPMFLLLISCGLLYLLLGNYREGIILMGTILIIVVITFIQYRKTERALEALRGMAAPRALVVRDSSEIRIPGREVVCGDLLVLHEGDRIAADGLVLSAVNLTVDESLLTGESVPVRKSESKEHCDVFSGTLVVQGRAFVNVTRIGQDTRFGQIGKTLENISEEETRLQREMKKLIRTLFMLGIFISIVVVLMFYVTRGQFIQALLNGLAASMAILPEEFPVILTIFLALGAWRLSKNNVLTRKSSAIENLGAATVLCSDKTGTITKNTMTVNGVIVNGGFHASDNFLSADNDVSQVLRSASLASHKDSIDPMERAILKAAENVLPVKLNMEFIREYPLSNQLMAMTMVYRLADGSQQAFTKGAPEAIAKLCGMNELELAKLMLDVKQLAESGYRVLGVADCSFLTGELPGEQAEFHMDFIGLLALEDPIREEVPEAISQCREAGIRVIMITGDYPATAKAIGRKIGMDAEENVMTGAELDLMTDEELKERIGRINIFARVIPEQKLRIVSALKANGDVVAMTGDGVNDAPALKAADIGISMGAKGTDVAREASSIVLLDDNFASIVAAIRSGRRIFDNLQKAMSYIMAIHIPIIGLTLIPAFFSEMTLILFPIHIVFMELIIDPVCSVAFEAEKEERGIMKRKPRKPDEMFFGRKKILESVFKGALLLLVVLIVYALSIQEGHTDGEVRAIAFSALIVGNVFLILTELSKTRSVVDVVLEKNYFTLAIVTLALTILVVIISIPSFSYIFSFSFPGYAHFIPSLTAAGILLLILETIKWNRNRST